MNGETVVSQKMKISAVQKSASQSASRAITFGTQRFAAGRNQARRLFVPVRNMISNAVDSATINPRAILRMVTGYC